MVYSATPRPGDARFFFDVAERPGRWIVSPMPDIWVVYLKGPKTPMGWVDLTDPQPRALRTFERE
jgi:hypothetical protein